MDNNEEGLGKKDRNTFASILSDGKIHVASEEGVEDVVRRDYETSKGEKGVKYELLYDHVTGKIKKIFFQKGDFGEQIHIVIGGVELSLPVSNNFAQDLMKKIPNIEIGETVQLAGYAFKDAETGKDKRGITVVQGLDDEGKGVKLSNFFWNGKKDLHDFPTANDGKSTAKWDSDDWKVHFIKVTKFLVKYITDNHLVGEETPKEDFDPEEEKA